jgi:hypothetical protein
MVMLTCAFACEGAAASKKAPTAVMAANNFQLFIVSPLNCEFEPLFLPANSAKCRRKPSESSEPIQQEPKTTQIWWDAGSASPIRSWPALLLNGSEDKKNTN